jgi:uncharacterized protein (DUF433 family)
MKRKLFGKYIVADPKICHGKLTFIGTRIFVKDVLEMVAEGMDWDRIIKEWNGHITREAIAEAVRLAGSSRTVAVERLTGVYSTYSKPTFP